MKRQRHNLEQGSKEWHDFRASHYGASELNAALGRSRFYPHNAEELKAVRMGILPPPFYSSAMRDGNEYEGRARDLAGEALEPFEPAVYSFGKLSASLDGINLDGDTIIEIKVSGKPMEELVDQYMSQIQQQLYVSGAKVAYLVAYRKEDDAIEIGWAIELGAEWADTIEKAWENYEQVKPATAREEVRDDDEWIEAAKRYKELDAKIQELKAELDEAKSKLISLADGKKAKGGGLTVYPTKPRKSVEWSTLAKKLNPTKELIEEYTQEGKPSWSVRKS